MSEIKKVISNKGKGFRSTPKLKTLLAKTMGNVYGDGFYFAKNYPSNEAYRKLAQECSDLGYEICESFSSPIDLDGLEKAFDRFSNLSLSDKIADSDKLRIKMVKDDINKIRETMKSLQR